MKITVEPGENWTDNEIRVAAAIDKFGSKENPLSRSKLCILTGLGDRTVRHIKQRLIMEHRIRIETSPFGGYYIPEKDDPDSAADVEFKRAKTTFVKVAILRGLTAKQAAGEIQQALSLTTEKKTDG